MTVNDLREGEKAVIVGISGLEGQITQKLMDLGLLRGVAVTMVHRAPLGDPVWVELKGYQLALRGDLARHIEIEEVIK
ncbi:MAG: FeoA family protein [Clostridiales bacterium]